MKNLDNLCSYKSIKEFPKESKSNQIYLDKAKNSILVPFKKDDGTIFMVPFHVLTVKNASINTENNISYLRLNFHCPGQGLSSKEVNFPSMKG
jgi:nucleosome binding factor SPN SPT16 subunit